MTTITVSDNFTMEELDAARDKYWRKSKAKFVPFTLTFEDYLSKMLEAGISPHEIGTRRGQYVLGRKCEVTGKVDGDLPYSVNTCRFITGAENMAESEIGKRSKDKCKPVNTNPEPPAARVTEYVFD